jgi:secondary thiamine-phosphate synthase enzyme
MPVTPWSGYASKKLGIQTNARSELVDLTSQLQKLAATEGLQDGMMIVFVPHTTAGVCINENADPTVKSDVLTKLESLIAKQEQYYRHAEGNSDSHVKTILTGNSVTLLIENGRILLGQWQAVYFAEFDGPRQRDVIVKLVGGVRNG